MRDNKPHMISFLHTHSCCILQQPHNFYSYHLWISKGIIRPYPVAFRSFCSAFSPEKAWPSLMPCLPQQLGDLPLVLVLADMDKSLGTGLQGMPEAGFAPELIILRGTNKRLRNKTPHWPTSKSSKVVNLEPEQRVARSHWFMQSLRSFLHC